MNKRTEQRTGLRRRAEDQLLDQQQGQGRRAADQATARDASRLVHELQVHQIELEMQNEELKQARARTDALLTQYTDLYDFAPTGYLSLDREGLIRQVNLTGAGLFRVARSDLLERRCGLFVAQGDRGAFSAFLQRAFASHTKECCEVVLPRQGAQPLLVRIEGIVADEGQDCRASVLDITELKAAERRVHDYSARLRELSRRLMENEEKARHQLGRELHDRVGPNLSAMLLSIGMIRSRLPPPMLQELGPNLDDCGTLLNETVGYLRDVLADLRPPALHDLGLLAALGHLLRQTAARSGINVDIKGHEPAPRVPQTIEIALFRIVQEALTNVVKHAQATGVSLALRTKGNRVVLTLADNGRGFDAAAPYQAGAGLGLTTMRERAEALGGRLTVESAPGTGTRVTVAVPRGGGRNDEYSRAG